MFFPRLFFPLLTLLLVSCGTTDKAGHYKLGHPYEIDGQLYIPKEDPKYDEIGIASWYGEEFEGRKTANGEIFNSQKLSAAHKTLPLPSYVRITNLDNQKSLILRVNDRGPFVRERIVDVSELAAMQLGFHKEGKALVRVQFLPTKSFRAAQAAKIYKQWEKNEDILASNYIPTVSRQGDAYVQAGAYREKANIDDLIRTLDRENLILGTPIIERVAIGDDDIFRLRFGPFVTQEDASDFRQTLQQRGVHDAYIVIR